MFAECGLAFLAILSIVNGQASTTTATSVESRLLEQQSRHLTDSSNERFAPSCPAGYWDKTYGNALSWACGQGCPGGSYTWNDCSCACIFGTAPPNPNDSTQPGSGGGGGGGATTTPRVIYSTSSWTFAPVEEDTEVSSGDDGMGVGMIVAIGFAILAGVLMCSICLAYALIMYSRSLDEEAEAARARPRVVKAVSKMGKGLDQRYQSGRRFSMDNLGVTAGKKLFRRLSMTMGFGGSKEEPVSRMLGPMNTVGADEQGEDELRKNGKVDVEQAMVTGVVFYPMAQGVPLSEQRSQPITPNSALTPRSQGSGHRSRPSDGGSMGHAASDGTGGMLALRSEQPNKLHTPNGGDLARHVSSSAPVGAFSPTGARRRSLSPSHGGARRSSGASAGAMGATRSNRSQQPQLTPTGAAMTATRSNRSQQPTSPNMGPTRSNRSQNPHSLADPHSHGNMGSSSRSPSVGSSVRPEPMSRHASPQMMAVPSQMSRYASPQVVAVPSQMSRYASPHAPSPGGSPRPSHVPGAVYASPRGAR